MKSLPKRKSDETANVHFRSKRDCMGHRHNPCNQRGLLTLKEQTVIGIDEKLQRIAVGAIEQVSFDEEDNMDTIYDKAFNAANQALLSHGVAPHLASWIAGEEARLVAQP